MKVIYDKKINMIPIKSWADDIEDGALSQIHNLSNLPFAFKHISIMPDCHRGYGMPIGGVLATKDVIVPNAVGVDIGCGCCALKTSIHVDNISKAKLKDIMSDIRRAIPLGRNWHNKPQNNLPEYKDLNIVSREYDKAKLQLGTLGGGNHFLELQKDKDGFIWIMIHSGSRNVGKLVADYYNKLAIELNERYLSIVPKKWELAFLSWHEIKAKQYYAEMMWCLQFAFRSRLHMINKMADVLHSHTNCKFININNNSFVIPNDEALSYQVLKDNVINIHHNYANMENHYGKNVLIHRKGATLARKGIIGIIPGSQGTSSYIVCGRGKPESFMSCSHGAGRRMGRKEAQRILSIDEETKALDKKGVLHSIRNQKDLDEAPGAYKNIDDVMKAQNDLVEILYKLEPIAVIKGD